MNNLQTIKMLIIGSYVMVKYQAYNKYLMNEAL